MSDSPTVVALILAAGTSRRFGALKQLQVIGGRSLVRRAADAALATGLPVHVVTGAEHEAVAAQLAGTRVEIVHNLEWTRGMGRSLASGVRQIVAASPPPDAVLVMLADQPMVRTEDLAELVREHCSHPQAIVATDYGERLGPPCLFPASHFEALKALDGDQGARAVLQENRHAVRAIPMPHAAVDVDTPEDLARAAAGLRQSQPGR